MKAEEERFKVVYSLESAKQGVGQMAFQYTQAVTDVKRLKEEVT